MLRKQWVGNALTDLYFWQLAHQQVVDMWSFGDKKSSVHDFKVHEQQDDSFLFGYEAHSHPDENEEQITNA